MIGVFLAALLVSAPASPEFPRINGSLVCSVKDAVRGNDGPWSRDHCERVAAALNATPWPVTLLSIAVIESSLREKALSPIVRLSDGGVARDAGLAGVRCRLVRGRCSNLLLAGHPIRLSDLLVPEVNLAFAAKIVREKREACGSSRWPDCYNGNPSGSNRYGEQIRVLSAAVGGMAVKGGSERIREFAKKILRVVFRKKIS